MSSVSWTSPFWIWRWKLCYFFFLSAVLHLFLPCKFARSNKETTWVTWPQKSMKLHRKIGVPTFHQRRIGGIHSVVGTKYPFAPSSCPICLNAKTWENFRNLLWRHPLYHCMRKALKIISSCLLHSYCVNCHSFINLPSTYSSKNLRCHLSFYHQKAHLCSSAREAKTKTKKVTHEKEKDISHFLLLFIHQQSTRFAAEQTRKENIGEPHQSLTHTHTFTHSFTTALFINCCFCRGSRWRNAFKRNFSCFSFVLYLELFSRDFLRFRPKNYTLTKTRSVEEIKTDWKETSFRTR